MKVYIIAALSADGFIGRDEEQLSTSWTSKEDKAHFVEMTKESRVMIWGGNTYRTVGKGLPGRRLIVYTHQPINQPGVEATQQAPDKLLAQLEREGYESVAICGGQSIYDMFMAAKLVDDLYITVEPMLFGTGIPLIKSKMVAELQLKDQTKLNDDTLLMHYEVIK